MAMIRKLVRHGNGLAFCIPVVLLELLGWEGNEQFQYTVQDGKLIIEKVKENNQ